VVENRQVEFSTGRVRGCRKRWDLLIELSFYLPLWVVDCYSDSLIKRKVATAFVHNIVNVTFLRFLYLSSTKDIDGKSSPHQN
jgi:hypothetical protein